MMSNDRFRQYHSATWKLFEIFDFSKRKSTTIFLDVLVVA